MPTTPRKSRILLRDGKANVMMQNTVMKIFICIAIVIFIAAFTVPTNAASLDDGGGTLDEMMNKFEAKTDSIATTFIIAARRLFWILAVIQFTWAAIQLGLKGELSLTSFTQTVVREIMFIGFFFWLLNNYANLGHWIVDSLTQLGLNATGFPSVTPSKIFSQGIEIAFLAISKAYDSSVFKAVAAAVPVVVILVAFALAAAACAVYLIEFHILVPCGVILLGMGGSLWTKNYSENYLRSLFSIGMKLLVMQIIIGVTSSYMIDFITDMEGSGFEFQKIFTLAGISIVSWMLVQKIPEFASSIIAGSSFGRAGDLTSTAGAVAGAAGAVAGAMGGAAMTGAKIAAGYSDAMATGGSGGSGSGDSGGG